MMVVKLFANLVQQEPKKVTPETRNMSYLLEGSGHCAGRSKSKNKRRSDP
jgi:hypothetical protein